jgi:hypothetical protein
VWRQCCVCNGRRCVWQLMEWVCLFFIEVRSHSDFRMCIPTKKKKQINKNRANTKHTHIRACGRSPKRTTRMGTTFALLKFQTHRTTSTYTRGRNTETPAGLHVHPNRRQSKHTWTSKHKQTSVRALHETGDVQLCTTAQVLRVCRPQRRLRPRITAQTHADTRTHGIRRERAA